MLWYHPITHSILRGHGDGHNLVQQLDSALQRSNQRNIQLCEVIKIFLQLKDVFLGSGANVVGKFMPILEQCFVELDQLVAKDPACFEAIPELSCRNSILLKANSTANHVITNSIDSDGCSSKDSGINSFASFEDTSKSDISPNLDDSGFEASSDQIELSLSVISTSTIATNDTNSLESETKNEIQLSKQLDSIDDHEFKQEESTQMDSVFQIGNAITTPMESGLIGLLSFIIIRSHTKQLILPFCFVLFHFSQT